MARLVPAAQELVNQVRVLKPKSTYQVEDEPDGFNRHRTVSFDGRTSTWLRPILEAIDDPRVRSLDGDKKLTVRFVSDVRADRKDAYPLAETAKVLDDK